MNNEVTRKQEPDDDNPLSQITRAEIDVQIATAKKWPRNVARSMECVRTLALIDDDSAAACYYALPREDKRTGEKKIITGPSIRMAEIVANSWGNLRVVARSFPIGPNDRFVTVQAAVHDLESNVAVASEVQRRITTREGHRYSDDMVMVTTNAAMSIAIRNAVFKAVPRAMWGSILEECMARQNGTGRGKTLEVRRAEAIKTFHEIGIGQNRILSRLDRARIEDIDAEDIKTLRGLFTSIRDEEANPDELFPPVPEGPKGPAVKISKSMSGEREPGQEG